MKGLLRVNKNSKGLTSLLTKLDWPYSTTGEIVQLIMQKLPGPNKPIEENKEDHDKDVHAPLTLGVEKIRANINAIMACQKPRMIASNLSISRELVYSLRKELRRKARATLLFRQQPPTSSKLCKVAALQMISEFCSENTHTFYTASDVKQNLETSNKFDWVPSLSTIRRWMNQDLKMSFKKVNIRFKQEWTSEDITINLKFLWIFCWLVDNNYHLIYMDQFHIQDSTIKTYNWTKRWKQNYWFGNRRWNKLNWVVAISEYGPHNINIQEGSMNASTFAWFIEETIVKLKNDDKHSNQEFVLIFNNASINVAKKVAETILKLNWGAITLLPYTPEWNPSEIVTNIIKNKLDHDLKRHQ